MPKKYKRKTKGKYDRKIICQYSLAGELLREWETATQITLELGFDKSAILRCCKGSQKKSYWFIWKFKDKENEVKILNKDKKQQKEIHL